eukprot:TRINITY_DN2477_c0_g1_i1.p1 TRINITY_DN2477_c0_g1~~TRINITY_DN2477_c0_g1_i1.p1  ORF type:complete len:1022 (+),score=327.64 TRINITY_DN2477_c0_g1_i1:119-3184(+)
MNLQIQTDTTIKSFKLSDHLTNSARDSLLNIKKLHEKDNVGPFLNRRGSLPPISDLISIDITEDIETTDINEKVIRSAPPTPLSGLDDINLTFEKTEKENQNSEMLPPIIDENDENSILPSSSAITVAVRVRPMNEKERNFSKETLYVEKNSVVLVDPDQANQFRQRRRKVREFPYKNVFDTNVSTDIVFKTLVRPLIGDVLKGIAVTIFAYGATGSGKTHTLLGSGDYEGLAPKALRELYHSVKPSHHIQCRFLELYNEKVHDLLSDNPDHELSVRTDHVGEVIVNNATEIPAKSFGEALLTFQRGLRLRITKSTGANETSSRSHAIFEVSVASDEFVGKLCFVDLAGSERAQGTSNRGQRLQEGAAINRSLLTLGNCINALLKKETEQGNIHIPFRDSKLTRLLKSSLIGNVKSVMISCISPALTSFEETHNTLNYAIRASSIKKNISINFVPSTYQKSITDSKNISRYVNQINSLKKQVDCLVKEVANLKANQKQTSPYQQQQPINASQPSESGRKAMNSYVQSLIELLQNNNINVPQPPESFSKKPKSTHSPTKMPVPVSHFITASDESIIEKKLKSSQSTVIKTNDDVKFPKITKSSLISKSMIDLTPRNPSPKEKKEEYLNNSRDFNNNFDLNTKTEPIPRLLNSAQAKHYDLPSSNTQPKSNNQLQSALDRLEALVEMNQQVWSEKHGIERAIPNITNESKVSIDNASGSLNEIELDDSFITPRLNVSSLDDSLKLAEEQRNTHTLNNNDSPNVSNIARMKVSKNVDIKKPLKPIDTTPKHSTISRPINPSKSNQISKPIKPSKQARIKREGNVNLNINSTNVKRPSLKVNTDSDPDSTPDKLFNNHMKRQMSKESWNLLKKNQNDRAKKKNGPKQRRSDKFKRANPFSKHQLADDGKNDSESDFSEGNRLVRTDSEISNHLKVFKAKHLNSKDPIQSKNSKNTNQLNQKGIRKARGLKAVKAKISKNFGNVNNDERDVRKKHSKHSHFNEGDKVEPDLGIGIVGKAVDPNRLW